MAILAWAIITARGAEIGYAIVSTNNLNQQEHHSYQQAARQLEEQYIIVGYVVAVGVCPTAQAVKVQCQTFAVLAAAKAAQADQAWLK